MTHAKTLRGGFSLIELLVVISIIALLIGILLPTVAAVRARAIGIACASNLRQIGLGFEMYHGDYDEVFPRANWMPAPFQPQRADRLAINETLDAYIPLDDRQSQRVFTCPGDDVVHELTAAAAKADPNVNHENGVSYYYQSRLGGRTAASTWMVRRLGLTESDVLVMSDLDGSDFVFNFDEDMDDSVWDTTAGTIDVGFNHLNRNALYADGHVAYALGNQ
ncbi:MAG: prepilin-type N-terminal cleavage/methylation domain-containing protein [Planctomycetota bacterium]